MQVHSSKAILAALVLIGLAVAPATASVLHRPLPGQDFVNVNVSLNMEIPIAGENAIDMASAQIDGRKIIYRLATSECPILKQTIAATCKLKNLNVSTQVRRQNTPVPVLLHVNGNAQFVITLKPDNEVD